MEDVCREYCRPYSPELSALEYEQCISNCKDVYKLLAQLVELVKKHCEDEVKERAEIVREKVYKICLGYHLGMIAYHPELVEKLLKLIASNRGIKL